MPRGLWEPTSPSSLTTMGTSETRYLPQNMTAILGLVPNDRVGHVQDASVSQPLHCAVVLAQANVREDVSWDRSRPLRQRELTLRTEWKLWRLCGSRLYFGVHFSQSILFFRSLPYVCRWCVRVRLRDLRRRSKESTALALALPCTIQVYWTLAIPFCVTGTANGSRTRGFLSPLPASTLDADRFSSWLGPLAEKGFGDCGSFGNRVAIVVMLLPALGSRWVRRSIDS